MIIKRKYEWLGYLYENDPSSKIAIDDAFKVLQLDETLKKELLEYNYCNISAFLNIDCGIPGESYSYFMNEFEKLDKTEPYDNGLSFKDVSSIEYEASRKGSAIQMRFVSKFADCPYRIVGFAAIESIDGKPVINKGWEMASVYVAE